MLAEIKGAGGNDLEAMKNALVPSAAPLDGSVLGMCN